MDQLFIMKRYWGSDEEDIEDKEKSLPNCKSKVQKKEGVKIPVIDLDSNENCSLSSKEQELGVSVSQNSIDDDNGTNPNLFCNKQENICFLSDSDVEIINNSTCSSDLKSTKNKSNLNGTLDDCKKLKSNSAKKHKLINHETLTKSNKDFTSEKLDPLNGLVNTSNLIENNKGSTHNLNETIDTDCETKSKIGKRRKRNSDLQEIKISISPEHDISTINASIQPEILSETPLNGIIDTNNKIKLIDESKPKLKRIKSDKSVQQVYDTSKNTQNAEDVDQAFCTIGQVYYQKGETVKRTLPHWLNNPTYINVNLQGKETPISELNYLDSNTKNNLKNANIDFLFPVQLAVIPWLMQSKEQSLLIRPSDICVSAPTGSGKTLAFVLPIVQSLKDRVVCAIRAIVVLPVSELATQVFKVFETFVQGTDLKVVLLTGKKSFENEQNVIVKSNGQTIQSLVDIVVTTPGRIYDHIHRTKGFCLKRLRYLVIDEADRMMEDIQQGWLKQLEDAVFHDCIFSGCICSSYKRTFYEPTSAYNFGFISQPLQKLLYSATLTHDPEQLHTLSLFKPKLFTASSVCSDQEYKGSCAIPPGLKMLHVVCEEGVKPIVICHLIKFHNFQRVLCFTETVERAHRLHVVLEEMGLLSVREISSSNRAIQRKIVLEQFGSGKVNILVCSDLVARGIDIENIDCVISYDVPQHVKTYIHRIGRTARAGKNGTAIALLSEGEIPRFKKMLSPAGIKLPQKIPVNSEDLKPFVISYQTALSVADAKLKKERNHFPGRSIMNTKRK